MGQGQFYQQVHVLSCGAIEFSSIVNRDGHPFTPYCDLVDGCEDSWEVLGWLMHKVFPTDGVHEGVTSDGTHDITSYCNKELVDGCEDSWEVLGSLIHKVTTWCHYHLWDTWGSCQW